MQRAQFAAFVPIDRLRTEIGRFLRNQLIFNFLLRARLRGDRLQIRALC
jgi:hypothetical protein